MSSSIGKSETPQCLSVGEYEQLQKVAKGESPITQKTAVLAKKLFAAIESIKPKEGEVESDQLKAYRDLSKNICLKSAEAANWHPIRKFLSAIKNILLGRGKESSSAALAKEIPIDQIQVLISELKKKLDEIINPVNFLVLKDSKGRDLSSSEIELLECQQLEADLKNVRSILVKGGNEGSLFELDEVLATVTNRIKDWTFEEYKGSADEEVL